MENKAGDVRLNAENGGIINIKGGNGLYNGKGGSVSLRAGDATINIIEFKEALIQEIKQSNFSEDKKESLISKVKSWVASGADIATIAQFVVTLL